jgi:hypothetical protein
MKPDFPALAAQFRQDMRRHNFTDRERRLLDLLVDLTYGRDRVAVVIAELDELGDALGMPRQNIWTALRGVRSKRVVDVSDGRPPLYRVLPDATFWQTKALIHSDAAARALRRIEAQNGPAQAELFPPAPSLSMAIAEASIDAARHRLGTPSVIDLVRPPSSNRLREEPPKTPAKGPSVIESMTDKSPPLKSLEFTSSKASKLVNFQKGESEGETARLERGKQIFGEPTMRQWGGLWRKRARENPSKFDRVLNALELDLREGKPIANPGGYADDLWRNRFAD